MSRPRGRPRKIEDELAGIPGTAPGMGLRVSRRTQLMGVMGLGNGLPRPVEDGVAQQVLVEIPEICGRCGSTAVTFNRDIETPGPPRRISCFICGWDSFLVTPPHAAVVGDVEVERRALGKRATVRISPPVRSARPRRIDRRKHPTNVPEPPPRYAYEPERPLSFRRNGGVQVFP